MIKSISSRFLRVQTSMFRKNEVFLSRLNSSTTADYHSRIRNVGIVAHIDAGKTTTTEHILYMTGKIDSIGRVDRGDTVMDFLPQEKERGITISSAAITCNWKNHTINIIDTPGHVDFSVEVELATRVLDGCVVLIDAVSGVQCQTKSVWKRLNNAELPAIAFVNKMDRVGASLDHAIISMQHQLQTQCIAMQMPLFERDEATKDDRFVGFVDLLTKTRFKWPLSAFSGPASVAQTLQPIISTVAESEELYEEVLRHRDTLFESLASVDDAFLEIYLSGDTISVSDATQALRRAILSRRCLAVFCGATLRGVGTAALLDGVTALLPAPSDLTINSPPTVKNSSNPLDVECGLLVFKLSQQYSGSGGANGKGLVAYARVFNGQLQSGDVLRNIRTGQDERVVSVLRPEADCLMPATRAAVAGEVVCLAGLRHSRAGDLLLTKKDATLLFPNNASNKNYQSKSETPLNVVNNSNYSNIIKSSDRKSWLNRASFSVPPPVFALSLEAESATHLTQLEKALVILLQEDPSLQLTRDEESGQLILKGLGELHLEVAIDKLQRQHRVSVTAGQTYIACRETLQLNRDVSHHNLLDLVLRSADNNSETHNQESPIEDETTVLRHHAHYERVLEGGKKLFAEFDLKISPLPLSQLATPATFSVSSSVCDTLSATERDAVTDTLKRCFERGPKGYPVTGVHVEVESVTHDATHTTPGAIRACLSSAMHQLLDNSENNGVLLEPVMRLEVSVSQSHVGTVVSDLTARRRALHVQLRDNSSNNSNQVHNKVQSNNNSNNAMEEECVIECVAPLSAILGYATVLRSLTKGEGSFSAEYVTHLPVESS